MFWGKVNSVDSAFFSHQHLHVNLADLYTLPHPHLGTLFQKQGSDPQGRLSFTFSCKGWILLLAFPVLTLPPS